MHPRRTLPILSVVFPSTRFCSSGVHPCYAEPTECQRTYAIFPACAFHRLGRLKGTQDSAAPSNRKLFGCPQDWRQRGSEHMRRQERNWKALFRMLSADSCRKHDELAEHTPFSNVLTDQEKCRDDS